MARAFAARASLLCLLALPFVASCSDDNDGLPPATADAGDAATAPHPDGGGNLDASVPDAQTTGDGGSNVAALTACLDQPPSVLAMPPAAGLTCDLVPPGVTL